MLRAHRDALIRLLLDRGLTAKQVHDVLKQAGVMLSVSRIYEIAIETGKAVVHKQVANQPAAAVMDLILAAGCRVISPTFGFRYLLDHLRAACQPFGWHIARPALEAACAPRRPPRRPPHRTAHRAPP